MIFNAEFLEITFDFLGRNRQLTVFLSIVIAAGNVQKGKTDFIKPKSFEQHLCPTCLHRHLSKYLKRLERWTESLSSLQHKRA